MPLSCFMQQGFATPYTGLPWVEINLMSAIKADCSFKITKFPNISFVFDLKFDQRNINHLGATRFSKLCAVSCILSDCVIMGLDCDINFNHTVNFKPLSTYLEYDHLILSPFIFDHTLLFGPLTSHINKTLPHSNWYVFLWPIMHKTYPYGSAHKELFHLSFR